MAKKAPAGQFTWKIEKHQAFEETKHHSSKAWVWEPLGFSRVGFAPWVLQLRLTFTFRKAEMIRCGKPLWSEKREFAFIHMQNLVLRWFSQWSFLVPLIGGRYIIITQLAIYKWYISGLYCQLVWLYGTYHLLREPETTIDLVKVVKLSFEEKGVMWMDIFGMVVEGCDSDKWCVSF